MNSQIETLNSLGDEKRVDLKPRNFESDSCYNDTFSQ